MGMTDPIADMLTRIRNGARIYRERVGMPYSQLKEGVLRVLKDEGFIADYKVIDQENGRRTLFVFLKYGPDGEQVINRLQRVSKPSRRVYSPVLGLERNQVLEGLGVAVVSTSQGIMSDRECVKRHLGGEIICSVW